MVNHSLFPWPLVTLDFEASSLLPGTYPIEVGVCRWVGPGQPLEGWSTLIKPTAKWVELGVWSPDSALVHGIAREDLEAGLEPQAALERLNSIIGFRGHALVDGGEHDVRWLNMLVGASLDRAIFRLSDFDHVALRLEREGYARVVRYLDLTPVPHRALDDAVRLMRALAEGLGVDQPV